MVISRFHQADSVVISRFREKKVVEKTYKSKSKGLQRTLSIYGFLRELNLEHAAPLPKLLSVEMAGQSTKLIQEYVGPDYSQHMPVEEDKFWELHETSATELRNLGLMDRISRHKQNWALGHTFYVKKQLIFHKKTKFLYNKAYFFIKKICSKNVTIFL